MKKKYRIKRNEEFQEIIGRKQFKTSQSFVLYFKNKKEEKPRIGLSVSKKLGNAVERNKIKRQVRMMIQECSDFSGEKDAILIIRKPYLNNNYQDNKKDLETLLKKVKI